MPRDGRKRAGFFEFFTSVVSEGKVGLACSHEGVISAEWRFLDQRTVGIWFLDDERIRFSAIGRDGKFVDIEERNRIADRLKVTKALVEIPQELFDWRPG